MSLWKLAPYFYFIHQFQKTTLLMCENFLIFKLLKLLLWRSFGCVKLLLVKTLAILLWRSDVAGKVILT